MNLKYTMIIQWSEEDQLYLVQFPEFPGQKFITHGPTYQEAAENGRDALEGLIVQYCKTIINRSLNPLPYQRYKPSKSIMFSENHYKILKELVVGSSRTVTDNRAVKVLVAGIEGFIEAEG